MSAVRTPTERVFRHSLPRSGRMGAIARQREIIDGLRAELSAAVRAEGSGTGRVLLVAILRKALAAGRAEIRRRFEAGGTAAAVMREQCFLMDQLIHALFDVVIGELYPLANPTAGEKLALVAVGGYGRGELAPCSDIDLLFLLPYKRTPHTEQVVEALLYVLWDLGLKIGHAVRSVEDCLRHAKSDLTVRTSLLELRFLRGDEELFGELKRRFDLEIARGTAAQFIEAKLAERDERHRREGDSRYKLEPQCQGRQGRAARPAHAVLARQIHLPHRRRCQIGRSRRAVARGIAPFRARPGLPLDGTLPPALPDRARRGTADL